MPPLPGLDHLRYHRLMSDDLRFTQLRLPSGLCLHVAEQGARDGPAVLMLHGYTDSWFSFSRILPLLARDLRAIVPDQRGHGNSDQPAEGFTPDDFAKDAVQLLDALTIEQAIVVGHSMGSFVAQRIVAHAPERVSRLVLVGSAATARNPVTLELMEEVAALEDPVAADFVRAFQTSTIHRPVPEAFFEQIVVESRKVPARVWKAALAGLLDSDFAPGLEPIRCPTLVLGGDRDAVFAPSEQEQLARGIPGATIRIHRDIGHDPQWEAPEDFVADLLAFVQNAALSAGPGQPS
jgi:non-heme chloroperoxidase